MQRVLAGRVLFIAASFSDRGFSTASTTKLTGGNEAQRNCRPVERVVRLRSGFGVQRFLERDIPCAERSPLLCPRRSSAPRR